MDDANSVDAVIEFLRGPDQPNVGGYDRGWRAVVGPALLVAVAAALVGTVDLATGPVAVALLAVGLFAGAVVTHSATTRRCRVNYLTGVDTSGR